MKFANKFQPIQLPKEFCSNAIDDVLLVLLENVYNKNFNTSI